MKDGESGSIADMVRELAELLSETNLTEIEVEQNGQRVRVSRQMSAVMTQAMPMAAAPAAITPAGDAPQKAAGPQAGAVTSPMVGTVYLAPEPGKPPFVKVGDTVKEGDTLLIVEAMKTMNPILAPRSGTVREICISDAEPVEFGQPLLVIA
ncbi:MAG: acetyl-CoA carboxylase biotin carboxyl carrier protein [Alphaproteobacteria bacterium]|nr:acetyl-CoA carboxylase biotin carboxyl carrier protein [Alphaproteobacteria bacterium]MBN9577781.1 acetyl-CoA carboxylase biotin carboxyl carrier protein [Alphaproteobacteria bacterium]